MRRRLMSKRCLDLIIAIPALVVAAPVLAMIALAVRAALGRPVLFRQIRPGLNGRTFALWKFRTMTDERDTRGDLLPDSQRLRWLGRFLRRASLDELPELWNVVRGDMSLVGPRPLLVEYLERYTPEQFRRHEMPPGITGLAQVRGRNLLTWEERFALDIWYIDHWSPALDLRILAMTVWKVLVGEGIGHPGFATMEKYMGPRQGATVGRNGAARG